MTTISARISVFMLSIGFAFAVVPAAAQKTQGKSISKIRDECIAENPPARQADRAGQISRCIERKKAEGGAKN